MCLLLAVWDDHPEFSLVIAANRDEFYARPTREAHHWEDHDGIFGGRDLEAGGTWLAVNRDGWFAAVTNVRSEFPPGIRSRGHLAVDFLTGAGDIGTYLNTLAATQRDYDGYNILCCNGRQLGWFSNTVGERRILPPGIFGLSNALLDTPWPKVTRIKSAYRGHTARSQQEFVDALFAILADDVPAEQHLLPDTGVGATMERQLSPIFIDGEQYGTRCSTIVLLHRDGRLNFFERRFEKGRVMSGESSVEFVIDKVRP